MERMAANSLGTVRAPRGGVRSCKGWGQEAALRLLLNSFDPEVAGRERDGAGLDAIARSLETLGNDETLVVQANHLVGVFRTHEWAPRVLAVGGGPAGNWNFIGTQEILADTFEMFAAAGRDHFGGNLAGKLIVTGGMGRTGGAQALAATMNGAAILCIEIDPERIKLRMKRGACDVMVNDLDEALRILKNAVRKREAASVGLVGNCARVIPELAQRGVVPDLLTDRTGAEDPVGGYIPEGLSLDAAAELRGRDPGLYRKRAMESIGRHVEGMLALARLGSAVFEHGNNIHAMALEAGVKDAYNFSDSFTAHIRPLLRQGRGPVRWVALSGEPSDIQRTDRLALEIFSADETTSRWLRLAGKQVRFEGLPARACWLGYDGRERFGPAMNDLVARAELKAPMAIVCDDLEPGAEAFADWTLLGNLLHAASGASSVWVRGGGAPANWREASRMVAADGTVPMGARIAGTLTSAPALAIKRHAETNRHSDPMPSDGGF
jgi:urocanate hydratase